MFKKIFSDQRGLTFIELMIAIAIIVIISAVSVAYIRGDVVDEVESYTDQLAADIRYTRNLAVSRTSYDFGGGAGPEFPPGGYGIVINQGANDSYTIFADSGDDGYQAGADKVIKTIVIENTAIILDDANRASVLSSNYFTFKSENEAETDLELSSVNKYEIRVDYQVEGASYKGILSLGEESNEGFVWVSLGKSFQEYIYAPPLPPKPDEEDPAIMEL
jgi:prepilin-type N-terminal cleavage/methylation domain-containing protein